MTNAKYAQYASMNANTQPSMLHLLANSTPMLTRHPAGWQRITNRVSMYRPREVVVALPSVGGGIRVVMK